MRGLAINILNHFNDFGRQTSEEDVLLFRLERGKHNVFLF